MFSEVDIEILKQEIKKARQELDSIPTVNLEVFIPFIKNIMLYQSWTSEHIKINSEKFYVELKQEFEPGDDGTHGFKFKISETVPIKEKRYKVYNKNYLLFKKRIEEEFYVNSETDKTLLYLEFKSNVNYIDDITKEIIITDIKNCADGDFSQETIDKFYLINDYYKQQIIDIHEKALYDLNKEIAFKKLNMIPKILFE